MNPEPDIARLRIEVTDQVNPTLLAAALQSRLVGSGWVAGPENDVASAVFDAADPGRTTSGSSS